MKPYFIFVLFNKFDRGAIFLDALRLAATIPYAMGSSQSISVSLSAVFTQFLARPPHLSLQNGTFCRRFVLPGTAVGTLYGRFRSHSPQLAMIFQELSAAALLCTSCWSISVAFPLELVKPLQLLSLRLDSRVCKLIDQTNQKRAQHRCKDGSLPTSCPPRQSARHISCAAPCRHSTSAFRRQRQRSRTARHPCKTQWWS